MKKVKLSFVWWDAIVAIDYNENTLSWMKDQLLFWSGGQNRIDYEDGDIETAYLKMLAQEMLPLSQEYTIHGVTSHFVEAEGWAPLDDTFGVKLVSIDRWEFVDREICLEEI